MNRIISLALFAIALLSFSGAVLLLLNGFIDYLQTDRWPNLTLLQLGYDNHLVSARWFLSREWSWWLHDALQQIPVSAALIVVTPLAWWSSLRIDRR